MRAFTVVVGVLVAFSLIGADADAKRRKRKRGRRAKVLKKASKQTRVGINKLMGKYKWDMSSKKVLGTLVAKVRKDMEPVIKATRDPLEQDRKRREMFAQVKKVKKNYVRFTGKRSSWDVSLVDKEYAHKNNESMVVSWEKKERRFFFFHHDRLWKVFIAFNAEMFAGKTFEDFAGAMEARFGKAERKFTPTLTGDSKMDHMAWPKAGKTMLLAYDYTGFYGNFCLVLVNTKTFENVKSGRELNSPKRKYSDPLVESVVKPTVPRDEHSDIVDQITGKGTTAPKVSDSYKGSGSSGRSGSGSGSGSAYQPRRKKKVDPKDPLKGLDL